MAKPSDVLGDVLEVSAQARESAPTSLAAKRKEQTRSRRIEALSLRLAGLTYEQIAERLDISPEGARDMVNRTLDRAENQIVDEMRELEGARLDRAQAAIWTKVLEGDTKAVDTFLRISQRRARLYGLDSPTAINVSVGVRQEMEQALDDLQQVVMGKVLDSHYENTVEPERPPALDA